jgi:thioesterase domain-containing protein/acyl carrier protein
MSDGHWGLPATLRGVVVGMERVQPATLSAWHRMVGGRIRLFNAYGPAEATCIATLYEMGASEWEGGDVVPIGKPLPNVTAHVLDSGGVPLPVGVSGELYVGGEGLARGYVNAPDLTAERFVADRVSGHAAGRLYRTGDLAFYLPDGNLAFAGRADRQVKIRGFRVELDEIEAVLAEHRDVRQCAVTLQNQPGGQILVAYITSNGDLSPATDELRMHLARRVPGYMVPAGFVILPQLPVTANGKVDRLKLPPYVPEHSDPERPLLPPSTSTECRLCELWKEALGIEQVSIADSFFELGGDSVRVTRLITMIQRDLGKDVSLALLLRAPTVALLAAALDAGDTTGPFPPALISLQPFGSRPPFYCVHGSGRLRHLARHLGTDQPFLGLPRLDPPGSLQPHTMEDTAAMYVAQLRTFQPQGPYYLGGCCYAGVMAYEMARQLTASGESVPLLVLFDAVNPAIWGFRSWKTILAMARYHAGVLRELPLGESWEYAKGRLSTISRVARDGTRRALSKSNLPLPTAIPLDVTYAEAIGYDSYEPKPYGGPTLLFRGGWTRPYVDARFGWGDLVGDKLDVVNLPGEHLEMLEEPMVATLARQLEARLRSTAP